MQAQLSLARVRSRPPKNGTRWGGRRAGAGRKPANGVKALAPHAPRMAQSLKVPAHVSLRIAAGLPRLRQRKGYQLVQRAMARANLMERARICEVSIQHNHVHLIVEADDRAALTSLMKRFAITLAKGVNAAFTRRGRVVADRYHAVRLTTPTQVRAALAYVLGNWRRHGEDLRDTHRARTDRFSSGPFFAGWTDPTPPFLWLTALPFPDDGALPIRDPKSWLLREGWKRAGLLSPWERPGPTP